MINAIAAYLLALLFIGYENSETLGHDFVMLLTTFCSALGIMGLAAAMGDSDLWKLTCYSIMGLTCIATFVQFGPPDYWIMWIFLWALLLLPTVLLGILGSIIDALIRRKVPHLLYDAITVILVLPFIALLPIQVWSSSTFYIEWLTQ